MKSRYTEILQWVGAVFVIVGHIFNSIGPETYPLNIVAFTFGTVFFLLWTILVDNKPQLVVNLVAISACAFGLFKAYVG